MRWSLQLVPFAGIAFLWFIGVVRDQLGDVEDRLFSTVFLGSGLLFLAMLFAGAAVTTSSVLELAARPVPGRRGVGLRPGQHPDPGVGLRHADGGGVHAVGEHGRPADQGASRGGSPSSGYAVALVLLVAAGEHRWSQLIFPLWVLVLSLVILLTRPATAAPATDGGEGA